MDINNKCWSKRMHDMLGIPLEKRAELVDEPGKVVGHIPKDIAELTGLAEGTPICVGAHDQNCNTFGSGGVDDGTAVVVMGTFGSCFIVSDEPIRDPKGRLGLAIIPSRPFQIRPLQATAGIGIPSVTLKNSRLSW